MELTRRGFLKATTIGGSIALGFDVGKAKAEMREFKISRTTETRSICPYCAVSCGVIIHTLDEDISNANRLTKPKVRKPGSDKWEDITWDEAISKIARHIKGTRDKCFV